MKLFANCVALLLMLTSTILLAEDFSIEEENLNPVPKAINTAIRSDKTFSDYTDCKLIGRPVSITGKEGSGFAATTDEACGWGAYNGPFWLVDTTSNPPKVVLFEIGAGFEVGNKSHSGFRVIRTGGGSAGTCTNSTWQYKDGRYNIIKTKDCVDQ